MTLLTCFRPNSLTSTCAFIALVASTTTLHAQSSYYEEKTWTESAVVPPEVFNTETVQPFDMGKSSALAYGIDPASLIVGEDGVVRYVMVARSTSGALNVLYQGIRCATAETKTYARLSDKRTWNTSADAKWQALSFSGPTRPAMMLARQGVCEGRTVTGNAQKILAALRTVRADFR